MTKGDLYTRAETWQYAFSSQQDNVAIVSTARLDPTNYGQPADPERLQSRLRKMVSKRIGMMLYRLPPSQDRNSVLYSPILSVADLDQVGEKF